jgi:hypothetical protein
VKKTTTTSTTTEATGQMEAGAVSGSITKMAAPQ